MYFDKVGVEISRDELERLEYIFNVLEIYPRAKPDGKDLYISYNIRVSPKDIFLNGSELFLAPRIFDKLYNKGAAEVYLYPLGA